jgi:hypothetical protein
MALRNNLTLKFLSILLFAFGLVAPAFATTTAPELEARGNQCSVAGVEHHTSFNQLLFEESGGEEEREAKDHKPHFSLAPYDIIELGLTSQAFGFAGVQGYNSCPIQKLRAHPSLFRLHRSLLI